MQFWWFITMMTCGVTVGSSWAMVKVYPEDWFNYFVLLCSINVLGFLIVAGYQL